MTAIESIEAGTDLLAGYDLIGNFRSLFKSPLPLPGSLFLLCLRGHCSVNIHLSSYEMEAGSLAVVFPEQYLHIHQASPDCRFLFVAFSTELTRESSLFSKTLPCLPYIYDTPVIPLSDALFDFFTDLFRIAIKSKRLSELVFQAEQKQSFYYQLLLCIANLNRKHHSTPATRYNRNLEIVRELARHVIENYKTERNIAFYADKMHLSPQHLSTTIKKTTGKTLTDIISTFVINDAKGKLRSSELTIQEIAFSLNFPDISFFGKYFKRYTGMSPKQFRQQL